MPNTQSATLGGGCFWCLEAVFREMEGVEAVESGYMGGQKPNPTYQDVCTGRSGHVEVVRVRFRPEVTTYRDILEVFFSIHDPTTRDRQGNDVGSQYRSVIFYESEEQHVCAVKAIEELTAGRAFHAAIVTEVKPASQFYPAENYHQGYFENNPEQPYCSYVVAPKVRKFREKFAAKRKTAAS